MKLLVVTQAIDREHPVLGFFHGWLAELAKHCESIEAICLYEGEHQLPGNVTVHSLGKERLPAYLRFLRRPLYIARFTWLAWKLRHDYDAAFVHMNQEYTLVAGPLWKLLRKRVYMWRNHYAGSWLTDAAAFFCNAVFCTSRFSYTAKYKKTVLMPVGVNPELFREEGAVARKEHSILFLARMAPSKNPLLLLEALRELAARGIPFMATFAGSPLPEHDAYYRSLTGRAEHYGLSDRITFVPAVPTHEAPNLYRAHQVFVNCSPSGMFDKTLFEAAAAGCLVLAVSEDYKALAGERYAFHSSDELADRIEGLLALSGDTLLEERRNMQALAEAQALPVLIARLARAMGV